MKRTTKNIASRIDQLDQALFMGSDKEISITINLSDRETDEQIRSDLSKLAAFPLMEFEKTYKLHNKGYLCRLITLDAEGYHIDTAEHYRINFDDQLNVKETIKHEY